MIVSDRGIPLLLQEVPAQVTLTVENYCKWYSLFLVFPNGSVQKIDFPEVEFDEASVSDHKPSPKAVQIWCDQSNVLLHSEALEMIVGRWEIGHKGSYDPYSGTKAPATWCKIFGAKVLQPHGWRDKPFAIHIDVEEFALRCSQSTVIGRLNKLWEFL